MSDSSLGALATAASSRPSPREMFEQQLRMRLALLGVTLASAELGRGLTRTPVWMLMLRLPTGFMNVQASVARQGDVFASAVADDIANRVATYLRPYGV